MTVHLTMAEIVAAAQIGVCRYLQILKLGNRVKDKHGPPGSSCSTNGWQQQIEGACGEAAVAKALGIWWPATVGTFKRGGDVGDLIQVRTRSRHDYDLIIRDDDDASAMFVLVTGLCPVFIVRGWLRKRECVDAWRRNYGGMEEAWFVPQSALHPMEDMAFSQ